MVRAYLSLRVPSEVNPCLAITVTSLPTGISLVSPLYLARVAPPLSKGTELPCDFCVRPRGRIW